MQVRYEVFLTSAVRTVNRSIDADESGDIRQKLDADKTKAGLLRQMSSTGFIFIITARENVAGDITVHFKTSSSCPSHKP